MPADLELQLQSSVTKTAAFQGAGVTIPTGTPRRGLFARFLYSAANTSSGTGAVTFGIDLSRDGGSTWNTVSEAEPIALTTTAASGEVFAHFEMSKLTAAANDVQIRASVEAISGTGATITYQADVVPSRP